MRTSAIVGRIGRLERGARGRPCPASHVRQQLAEARGDLIKRATGRLAAAATKGARAWGA